MKFRIDFVTNSSSMQYIIRNLTNKELTLWDFLNTTRGLEYWEGFAKTSPDVAKRDLERTKIPPFGDIVRDISYTGEPGDGLVSTEGFYADRLKFNTIDMENAYGMKRVKILVSPDMVMSNRNWLNSWEKSFHVANFDAEEIRISLDSDYDYEDEGSCKLDLRNIKYFMNLKRLYLNIKEIDLFPLAACKFLEKLEISVYYGPKVNLTALTELPNLCSINYTDSGRNPGLSIDGTPAEVQEKIEEYQATNFPTKTKPKREDGSLGKVYVTGKIIGMSKDQVKEAVLSAGYQWLSSVSKNLDILVFGENAGPSKLKKAGGLGVQIMSWEKFKEQIGM